MTFNESQQRILATIPRVTAALSFLGSATILVRILAHNARTKLRRTYHRLCFAFSFFDCITSVWAGLSTWPIPAGTDGVYQPRGTMGTCSAQGFFLQLSIASPLYSSGLALYYLLLVKGELGEEQIAERYEPYMHAYAVALSTGFAFAGLGLELYNPAGMWCWIASYPEGCQGTDGIHGAVPCERGYGAWLYRWFFFYLPLWFTIVAVTVIMAMICRTVRQDEAKSIEHRFVERRSSDLEKQQVEMANIKFERSRTIFWQALWYSAAFYATWTAITIFRLTQLITGESNFALMVLAVTFFPLQGLWNSLVYNRGQIVA